MGTEQGNPKFTAEVSKSKTSRGPAEMRKQQTLKARVASTSYTTARNSAPNQSQSGFLKKVTADIGQQAQRPL